MHGEADALHRMRAACEGNVYVIDVEQWNGILSRLEGEVIFRMLRHAFTPV
jgi:hypothetical protein